jgi:hypothetical protein
MRLIGTRSVNASSSGTASTYAAKKMPMSQPASVADRCQQAMYVGSNAGKAKAPICANI